MNESNDSHLTVQDNSVVTLDYTLKVDGDVVDTSRDSEPIRFIQGQGQIIPGLEKELYGMSIGESRNVVVGPGEGYGELNQEAYADVPRHEFPPDIPMEKGTGLAMQDEDGETVHAFIDEIQGDNVRINFNHPLAGKDLHFSVTVVDLRQATEEELAHGHIHGEGGHGYEEEDEVWDDGDEALG